MFLGRWNMTDSKKAAPRIVYLAGGCYWGVEAFFKSLRGVLDTDVGFANGDEGLTGVTYSDVCTHTTGFAEAVRIVFDPDVISASDLFRQFFRIIDPTLLNRQGPDIGNQYRTGIYYPEDDCGIKTDAAAVIAEEQRKYNKKIVTELEPLRIYVSADEAHQDYLDKNPGGYCHIDLSKYVGTDDADTENAGAKCADAEYSDANSADVCNIYAKPKTLGIAPDSSGANG